MNDEYVTRQTLLMRARNRNDHDAWSEFVEVYQHFIFHVLNRMNVSENDFKDLVQEVLVRLWEKFGSYEPEKARFRSWLSFVIRNIVLNSIKKNSIRTEKMSQFADESDKYVTHQSDVEKMIEREWKLHISNLAMTTIKELFSGKAVEVFELSLQGFASDEISKRLNIARSSVKVLKSRVKSRYMAEVHRLINELEGC